MPVLEEEVKLRSSYLEYLPALYQDDDFMGQFLLIFESILKPIEHTVNNIPYYFDSLMTPEPVLPWLAAWVDLTLDDACPPECRRELIGEAAELYRWRGTRRGLTEYLRIYTGSTPEISEYIAGMKLDPETALGVDTRLGSSGEGHHFTVTLELEADSPIDTGHIRRIIDAQKPAHTVYTLQLNRREAVRQHN